MNLADGGPWDDGCGCSMTPRIQQPGVAAAEGGMVVAAAVVAAEVAAQRLSRLEVALRLVKAGAPDVGPAQHQLHLLLVPLLHHENADVSGGGITLHRRAALLQGRLARQAARDAAHHCSGDDCRRDAAGRCYVGAVLRSMYCRSTGCMVLTSGEWWKPLHKLLVARDARCCYVVSGCIRIRVMPGAAAWGGGSRHRSVWKRRDHA
jgi:hypothetical protein